MDTLILKILFLIIKLNNFRGDLSDISAKTATPVHIGGLQLSPDTWVCVSAYLSRHTMNLDTGAARYGERFAITKAGAFRSYTEGFVTSRFV